LTVLDSIRCIKYLHVIFALYIADEDIAKMLRYRLSESFYTQSSIHTIIT